MNTYKLGNKVTGIIRAYNRGTIGNMTMDYGNQPYTIVKSIEAELTFADLNATVKSRFNEMAYNDSKLSQIKISDVPLNDKILNLIFSKSETKLVSKAENYVSDSDKNIYINTSTEEIYQVFIYNKSGALEAAYGTLQIADPIQVSTAQEDYLICYQYEGSTAFSLDKPENQYFTLDLMVTGNKEDNTSNMTIHIEKCGLRVDKTMYFNQRSNAVDLIFTVIDTGKDYITLE